MQDEFQRFSDRKTDDPIPVIKDNNLLHPKIPKAATFNKKAVTLICIVLGIIALIAFGTVLSNPSDKSDDKPANQSDESQNEKDDSLSLVPDGISRAPSTYLGQDFSTKVKTDIPVPVLPRDDQSYKPNYVSNDISPEKQVEIDARKSSIRFGSQNQSTAVSNQRNTDSNDNLNINDLLPNGGFANMNSNDRDAKQEFLKSNSSSISFYTNSMGLRAPLSKFEVKAGTVIPVTLITGINSDLPGYITAQVRENVYDTVSGRFLLIPQGTRVIGVYDSKVAWAQNRLLVSWSRLILPNGQSLALEGMAGTDTAGYAGFKDKVNNHWGKIISGALLTSVLGAGSKMLSSSDPATVTTYADLAAAGAAESLAEAGSKVFEKNLNIPPTIEIRAGQKFNVFVDRDLILENYKK
jgi:type IV secretory pathway VirB10-like protein